MGGEEDRGDDLGGEDCKIDLSGGEVDSGKLDRVGVVEGVRVVAEDDEGGVDVTTQETGCPWAWLRQSRTGRRTGYEFGSDTSVREGLGDSRLDGKALEERYVAAVRYRSL